LALKEAGEPARTQAQHDMAVKTAVLALALSAHGFAPTQQATTRQVQVYGYVPSGVDPAVYAARSDEINVAFAPAPIINLGAAPPMGASFHTERRLEGL